MAMATLNAQRAYMRARRARLRPRHGRLIAVGICLAGLVFLAVSAGTRLPWFLCEFRGDLYNAGRDILHGVNPYHPGYIALQARIARGGGTPVTNFILPVYPAPALVAAATISWLPFSVAGTLYLLLSIAALLTAVRMLDVRDVRCLACMVLSIPVLLALIDGALTPVLVLGVALAWRWRQRAARCAVATAAAVVAKLFLLPLLLWLVVTRRHRALTWTVALAAVLVLAGWAVIGFAGLEGYPRMMSNLDAVESGAGVSVVAAVHALGVAWGGANAVALAVGLPLLAVAGLLAWRRGRERESFALAVLAALVATPIAWPNYLVLVYVPIALVSPRFSVLWLVPLLAWAAPQTQTHGHLAEIVPYLVIEATITVFILRAALSAGRPVAATGRRASANQTMAVVS